jgi:hypothetical protein
MLVVRDLVSIHRLYTRYDQVHMSYRLVDWYRGEANCSVGRLEAELRITHHNQALNWILRVRPRICIDISTLTS